MKPFIVVIVSYVFIVGSVNGAVQTGSPPVSWKLYERFKLTWNEAATFCRDQGGHLPVPDTHLSQSALKHWVNTWRKTRTQYV
ncbi:hypothetical protein V1264_003020 [Littorina saxatilis]|uniref:C-type lectin n=1 Tax=Littorina saxatilis TaxID=31220 RepID=A0AAN9B4V1_9CAEN